MYFDFEDNHPDISRVPHPLTWRDALSIALILHLLAIIGVLTAPPLDREKAEKVFAEQIALQQQREREAQRFVFVQPHLDMPAIKPPSPRALPSDKDRNAQTRERPKNPLNEMPSMRGNTPEHVEGRPAPEPPRERAEAPPQPAVPPGPQQQASGQSSAEAGSPPQARTSSGSLIVQNTRTGNGKVPDATAAQGDGAGQGLLGSAMRDVQRIIRQDAFDNQGGGNNPYGQSIQFDTKGVEFGPWLRRFIAQLKRNWFIPYAAMAMKGHVVVTFYIHKDGSITALSVPGPCNVDAFNHAAANAVAASNPTYPLPPEYPSDRAFFTVTFYYNEYPPG